MSPQLKVVKNKRYLPVESDDDQVELHFTSPEDVMIMTWRRRFYMLLAFSFFCLSLLGGLFLYKMDTSCRPFMPDSDVTVPYSPAPVTYVNKWLKGDPDTPKFVGTPSIEMDHAWHKLLSGTAIRFSEEELALANNATSIRLQDGGYVAGLGISHSLHCVKRIKQYLHPEYYYTGDQNWEELFMHVDHCLESLRQTVMCSADVSVYTLEWTPHNDAIAGVVHEVATESDTLMDAKRLQTFRAGFLAFYVQLSWVLACLPSAQMVIANAEVEARVCTMSGLSTSSMHLY
ncbi:uncharacterized protein LA080_009965 [Diaporthe eres]|nr:uncharacterized protein LA080_009965 [Diaporthe eres]